MLKRLMISTAAAALLVGSAAAQQNPPMAQKNTMPEVRTTTTERFVTNQTADQWLASKFKGTDVMGTNNEKIGDVSDILFDQNGRVLAYVVGVGGFLGIGAKDVALVPSAFQVHMDNNTAKLTLAMTKEELKNAPEFKPYTAPRATTGQGSSNRNAVTPPAQR